MANIPASKNNGRVARVVSGQRGGPGRGQGRKPVKAGEETVTVSLRMTEAQREKLALLGCADWIRKRIDKAKAPNDGLAGTQRLLDVEAAGHRLALELECMLLDTKDLPTVSRWWESGMQALEEWQRMFPYNGPRLGGD